MNMMEGCNNLAIANNARTNFSLSPRYLETREDAEMEKKVPLHSVATAFAFFPPLHSLNHNSNKIKEARDDKGNGIMKQCTKGRIVAEGIKRVEGRNGKLR